MSLDNHGYNARLHLYNPLQIAHISVEDTDRRTAWSPRIALYVLVTITTLPRTRQAATYEVLTAVLSVLDSQLEMSCGIAGTYQRFGGAYSLHHQG